MYNYTKHHSGSTVARVTNDRAARPHLPSTVNNQLGRRRRQLLTLAHWNVRTLLDRDYFFRSGKPDGERRETGVGFAIKKDIVTKLTEMQRSVCDTTMTMRLPTSKDTCICYNYHRVRSNMTNPYQNKETFYN